MPPFDLDDEPAALLYLINLTAGLLDGDGHLIELIARAGTRAVVTGQAATRVHPAVASFCTQQWAVEVEDDACLVVLPGPTIPYRGSRYLPARPGRARADRPADLGGHLAGRPLRAGGRVGAVPSSIGSSRTSRSGAPAGCSTATASDGTAPGRRRRSTGTSAAHLAAGEPLRVRPAAGAPPRPRPGPPPGGLPARRRRVLRPMVRPPGRSSPPTWSGPPCNWPPTGPAAPARPPGCSDRAAWPRTTGSPRRPAIREARRVDDRTANVIEEDPRERRRGGARTAPGPRAERAIPRRRGPPVAARSRRRGRSSRCSAGS